MEGDLIVMPLRGGVCLMAMEPAANLGVSIREGGAFVIDDQFAPMTNGRRASLRAD
jgi:hypothetical protein